MHMPLTAETRHLINADRIAKMKRGARIVNCARGGLIDEQALFEALKSGQIAAAALDVYETEPPPAEFPLRTLPNIVFTPHLGASTAEAQESVGIEIAEAIRSLLLEGVIRNAVNVPNIDAKTLAVIAPYLAFGEKLGRFLRQVAPKRCEMLSINYSGKVNEFETSPISRYILKGIFGGSRRRGSKSGQRHLPRPDAGTEDGRDQRIALLANSPTWSIFRRSAGEKPSRWREPLSDRRQELFGSTAAMSRRDRSEFCFYWKITMCLELLAKSAQFWERTR